MNYLYNAVRPGFHNKPTPSSYADLIALRKFLNAIRCGWTGAELSAVPSEGDLDRFLMMYGKALKSRSALTARGVRTERRMDEKPEYSHAVTDSNTNSTIRLPFGGPGATFEVSR